MRHEADSAPDLVEALLQQIDAHVQTEEVLSRVSSALASLACQEDHHISSDASKLDPHLPQIQQVTDQVGTAKNAEAAQSSTPSWKANDWIRIILMLTVLSFNSGNSFPATDCQRGGQVTAGNKAWINCNTHGCNCNAYHHQHCSSCQHCPDR